MISPTTILCEYVADAAWADLPEAVTTSASWSLMDAVGVSLAASALDPAARVFMDLAEAEGGREDSTIIGGRLRVPAATAALANGALAHALDFEDALDGLPIHPNAQVIPAVLALAEERDLSGAQLLCSIAIGCDITRRLAVAAGPGVDAAGWYPPPIFGALGAAAGCANLLGLDAPRVRDAMSLVLSQAAGSGQLKHSPQSLIRGIRDAFASHAAVRAAQLAEQGIIGFEDPLAGKRGFFETFAGGRWDAEPLTHRLGTEFGSTMVSYKLWPSCRGTHAFVQGALELRPSLPAQVQSIELSGGPVCRMLAEPLAAKRAPKTAIDAKFSLPFTVATCLVHGEVTLASFTPEALTDAAVLDMAERVTFRVDPEMAGPEFMTAGRTVISGLSGEKVTYETRTPLGSPQAPLTHEQILKKFTDCSAAAGLDVLAARERAARILGIASSAGIRSTLAAVLAG